MASFLPGYFVSVIGIVVVMNQVVYADDWRSAKNVDELQQKEATRQIVREMLYKNVDWLAPEASFDLLQYTFHTEREDVRESCVLLRDGLTVFEVTQDGKGKMADRLGERLIVLPNGCTAKAQRGEPWALVHDDNDDRRPPNRAEQLRRYALIGCQFDLPLFELDRVLGDAHVKVTDGQWDGMPCQVATISIPGRPPYLGCGTMLGFTSWSYVHHQYPAYETIYIDKARQVPLHETFVSSDGDRRFDIDYLDYTPLESDVSDALVPLRIELMCADHFICKYQFQLIDGQHWLLDNVVSWFSPDDKSRGVVEDVRVDEPSQLAEDAQQQLDAYRELFEEETPTSDTIAVDALPFQLGHPVQIRAAELVFTFDGRENLILRCTADDDAWSVGNAVNVLLLDKNDRIIRATQGKFVGEGGRLTAQVSFGRSLALRDSARFMTSGLGDLSQIDGVQKRHLRVCNPSPAEHPIPMRGISDASGKTRLVDVALERNDNKHLTAVVHFASCDTLKEFVFDASVAVFDKSGRLLSTSSKSGNVKVESDVQDETWEITLSASLNPDDIGSLAVGLSRGQTVSMPIGSFWGNLVDRGVPFDVETLLAADDPGCWPVALRTIGDQVEEALDHGLLGREHRWRDQVAEHETPADLLMPYVDQLLEIVAQAEAPGTMSTAVRLLGYSGDERAIAPSRRLLGHEEEEVQDAAAIALGMLHRDEGLSRLDEILSRPEPSGDDPRHRVKYNTKRDALIALATIRSDASIELVRKWMQTYVTGVEFVPTEHGSSWSGTKYDADRLAMLMGRLPDPKYVDILTNAVERLESRDDLGERVDVGDMLTSVLQYGDAAHNFIAARVRRGDGATLYALKHAPDGEYVRAVRAMLESEATAGTWASAIDYLWNNGSAEAIDVLREAFKRGIASGQDEKATRLQLAEALAHFGDHRGLPEALEVLAELAQPGTPPEDKDARRDWERKIDDLRGDALDVFERAETSAVIELVTSHANSENPASQMALLTILENIRSLPESMRPFVERWSESDSEAVAERAAKLLARE